MNARIQAIRGRIAAPWYAVKRAKKSVSYEFYPPDPRNKSTIEAIAPDGGNFEQIELVPSTDLAFLTAALEVAMGELKHITTCVEREDDHYTADTSNFYRLSDARKTAERALSRIEKLSGEV